MSNRPSQTAETVESVQGRGMRTLQQQHAVVVVEGGECMYMYGRLVRLQRSLYVWGSEEETGKQREHEENTEKKRLGGQRGKRDRRADEEGGKHKRDE